MVYKSISKVRYTTLHFSQLKYSSNSTKVPPKVRAGEEGSSGEESESDSESESGESQSSSASDGDGSSSESD